MCSGSLKQRVISLSSCEQPVLAQENFEILHKFSKNITTKFHFDLRWTRILHIKNTIEEDFGHIEIRCSAIQPWAREKRHSLGRVDTKSSAADLFTIFSRDQRTLSLSKKLRLHVTAGTDD